MKESRSIERWAKLVEANSSEYDIKPDPEFKKAVDFMDSYAKQSNLKFALRISGKCVGVFNGFMEAVDGVYSEKAKFYIEQIMTDQMDFDDEAAGDQDDEEFQPVRYSKAEIANKAENAAGDIEEMLLEACSDKLDEYFKDIEEEGEVVDFASWIENSGAEGDIASTVDRESEYDYQAGVYFASPEEVRSFTNIGKK